ncbi:MAG TPA: hypothetical protein P5568_07065 [Acidobacteriota bacterium]|nr:hypothetical protein [Acidobacteriota bacterium]
MDSGGVDSAASVEAPPVEVEPDGVGEMEGRNAESVEAPGEVKS